MAEIGVAAAILQLLRYGTELGIFATALPGLIRDAPNKIATWTHRSQAMLGLLDDIKSRFPNIDSNTSYLIQQCREDLIKLLSILRPVCLGTDASRRQRLRNASFVVRNEQELQQMMLSSKDTFNMIALSVIMLSPRQLEPRGQGSSTALFPEATLSKPTDISEGFSAISDISATITLFAATHIPLRLLANFATADQLRTQLSALGCAARIELGPTGEQITMEPSARRRLRAQLYMSPGYFKCQTLALGAVYIHFPSSFAQPHQLQQGHELYPHVSAIIQHVMDVLPNDCIVDDLASVSLRCCMYLLAIGKYARAANIALKFQEWCQQGSIAAFEMLTSFQAKEAIARALQGELKAGLRLQRGIYRERRLKLGRTDSQTVHGLNNVAIAYQDIGRYDRAVLYHQEALRSKIIELGSNDPDAILSLNNLGVTLQYQGHYDTAEEMFRQTLSAWSKVYEADDLYLLTARSNLGIALHLQGRYQEAEALQRYVSTERQRTLGRTHHETMKSRANLAMTLNEMGRHAQAETIYREVLHTYQRKLGASHPDTLKVHHNLATALHDQGKYGDAELNIKTSLPHLRLVYGDAHAESLEAMEFRAILLHCLERYKPALDVAIEVYETRKEHLGFDHDDTQRSLCHVRDLAEDCEEEKTMADFPTFISIAVD